MVSTMNIVGGLEKGRGIAVQFVGTPNASK